MPKYIGFFGPLWTTWCFPFESALGINKKFISGTKQPEISFIFGSSSVVAVEQMKIRASLPEVSKISQIF